MHFFIVISALLFSSVVAAPIALPNEARLRPARDINVAEDIVARTVAVAGVMDNWF
ncbi:hypothetical protein GYMLUDRAFT_240916 [Collybiopsis luxurians FD-317 M1]|nr:hypothetical protein GYMLUDRAFT_240916 [Collybiopsis luxurians FD-317 M1]